MNQVLETIEQRFSCRNYSDRQVEQEKIEAIVKAGLQSPSALNKQPWHVIVITDKGLIAELNDHALEVMKSWENKTTYDRIMERGGKPYYNANVMYVILRDEAAPDFSAHDCGIMAQSMVLAAASLEIDTVIAAMAGIPFSGPQADYFKTKIQWPAGFEFGLGVLAGYGNVKNQPHAIDLGKVTYI